MNTASSTSGNCSGETAPQHAPFWAVPQQTPPESLSTPAPVRRTYHSSGWIQEGGAHFPVSDKEVLFQDVHILFLKLLYSPQLFSKSGNTTTTTVLNTWQSHLHRSSLAQAQILLHRCIRSLLSHSCKFRFHMGFQQHIHQYLQVVRPRQEYMGYTQPN